MNAIIGFTELLSEQLSEPRLKSYVKTIQTASSTLLTLINDILDLSKIEAGKLQINKTPTDVGKLCTEIASIFTMKIKEKGLDIFVNIDTNIPKSLLVDEIRLRQILLNLVGNAVKFTENGYIKLNVNALNIDDHLSKLDLEIIVEDTGLGIAPSQLKKIFKEFEQNEGQDNRKYGGTGLGLSISKRLSEMMDGDISVESKEGEGSKFRVKLTHIDISSVVSEKRVDKKVSKDVKSIVFKEAKILIVDDIEDNRELIIKNFEDTKIQVITAHNGLEAIERFKNEKPDLILMDIRMPVMDGYEAALKIKEISQVPIVALTASVMQDKAEQSKRENFDGFLRKPVLRYELFTELSKFLKYDLSQVSKNEEDLNIQMSEKAKTNLSNILQILSTDIKKLQLKALQTNNITEIKNLAFSIRSLAIEFDVEILDRYASKLYEATDAFDIEIIEQLINSYDDLVNKFTEL
jgi:two-component system, NarL family, sensor histidine kinase EvgS